MGTSKAWRWIAGGAVVAGALLRARAEGSQNVRACREAVTVDDNGAPRNAEGHVRNCWPGDRGCTCDRDGDCYAGAGTLGLASMTRSIADGSRPAPQHHRRGRRTPPRGLGRRGGRTAPSSAAASGPRRPGRMTGGAPARIPR